MRAIVVLVMAIASPAAADPCKPKTEKVTFHFFPQHTVDELATWLTATTCKPVQFGKDVPKHALKVSIVAPREYTPKQAVDLVVASIEATGLRVKQGATFAIELANLPAACQDAPTAAAPEHPLHKDILAGIRKLDETHYEVSGALLDKLAVDLAVGTWGARIIPAAKDGKPDGFKLYAIRPSSAVAHLGFANGDTVRTIDGVVTHTVPGADILAQVRKRKQVSVEIARRGKSMTLVYTITK